MVTCEPPDADAAGIIANTIAPVIMIDNIFLKAVFKAQTPFIASFTLYYTPTSVRRASIIFDLGKNNLSVHTCLTISYSGMLEIPMKNDIIWYKRKYAARASVIPSG